MADKKTILVVAAVLCLSMAITAISFSIVLEKQKVLVPHKPKLSSRPVSQQSTIPADVLAAKRLREKRQQVAIQKYEQMKKRGLAGINGDKSPLSKTALQRNSSWREWPLGKRGDRTQSRRDLFPYVKGSTSSPQIIAQFSDLTVVSTHPGDQATDIPLETEISVTFSDLLDKYAALEIVLFPTALSYSDPVISTDGKTVSTTAKLNSNTTYQLFVMAAVTPDSQQIKPQIAATFSTGSSKPTGSIY